MRVGSWNLIPSDSWLSSKVRGTIRQERTWILLWSQIVQLTKQNIKDEFRKKKVVKQTSWAVLICAFTSLWLTHYHCSKAEHHSFFGDLCSYTPSGNVRQQFSQALKTVLTSKVQKSTRCPIKGFNAYIAAGVISNYTILTVKHLTKQSGAPRLQLNKHMVRKPYMVPSTPPVCLTLLLWGGREQTLTGKTQPYCQTPGTAWNASGNERLDVSHHSGIPRKLTSSVHQLCRVYMQLVKQYYCDLNFESCLNLWSASTHHSVLLLLHVSWVVLHEPPHNGKHRQWVTHYSTGTIYSLHVYHKRKNR